MEAKDHSATTLNKQETSILQAQDSGPQRGKIIPLMKEEICRETYPSEFKVLQDFECLNRDI